MATKGLTEKLSPLESTLTKIPGWGDKAADRSVHHYVIPSGVRGARNLSSNPERSFYEMPRSGQRDEMIKKAGQAEGGLCGSEQRCWRGAGKTLDLTGHVRLICIACVRRKLREVAWSVRVAGEVQEALKTQHRLKHFRAVADGGGEPPLELAAADSDPLTEFFDLAAGIPGEPLDGGAHGFIDRGGVGEAIEQN